jgi:hypothetical protein
VNTDPAANRRALEGITNTDTAANRAAIGDRIPQGIKDFADLFREKPGQDYAVPFAEVDPAAGRHDDIANLLRTEFETTHRPEGLINAANALWPGNVAMGALKAVAPYVGQVETASGDPQAPVHRVFGSFGQLVGGPYTSATLSEEGKQLPGWGMAGTGARSMERVANWAADHPQEAAEWAATTPFPGMENTQTPIGVGRIATARLDGGRRRAAAPVSRRCQAPRGDGPGRLLRRCRRRPRSGQGLAGGGGDGERRAAS